MTKRSERSQRLTNVWQKPRRKTLPTKKRRWPSLNRELAFSRNLFRREGKSPSHLLKSNQPCSKNHLFVMVDKTDQGRGVTVAAVVGGLAWFKRSERVRFRIVETLSRLSQVCPFYLNEKSTVIAILDNILYAGNSKLLLKVELNCVSIGVLLVNVTSRKSCRVSSSYFFLLFSIFWPASYFLLFFHEIPSFSYFLGFY